MARSCDPRSEGRAPWRRRSGWCRATPWECVRHHLVRSPRRRHTRCTNGGTMAKQVTDESGRSTLVLSFLIADVRGYSRFTAERGDAAAALLAKRFADLARDAVEARGGRVIELRGDEALAVFESPSQAVRAAVEFQATCAEESEADPAFPLPVGIGIDSGEAVPVEDGYRGVALNTAARLCSNAGAGQVLVTRTIVASTEAADAGITFVERGPASFKGFEQAVDVIEAFASQARAALPRVGPTLERTKDQERGIPAELDPLTPLVDREHEMRWLRGTWRMVRRGRGRMLFVSGPAQIGKTRLAGEIAAHVYAGGGAIRYAGPGGAATAMALSAISGAREASTPTLLVLDDVDVAGPQGAEELQASLEVLSGRPVLVLGLLRDRTAVADLARLIERAHERGDGHRGLAPLDIDGVRGIVRLYVGQDETDAPVESMARASQGVPGRVHEVASEWARSEASRRLAAAAEFLAAGRDRHASNLEFANNVIGLKLGRLYSVEGRDVLAVETCPYKGLAAFERDDSAYFFGRERLVGELAARTVQVGLLGVVGASGSGKSSVIGAGLLPSLAAGLLPGSENWKQVAVRPGEHPMNVLRAALSNGAEDPIEAAVGALTPEGRLVLVVDQFEETACGWSLPLQTPWWRRCPTNPEDCRSFRPRLLSCGRLARTGGSGWKPMNRPGASVARSLGSPRPRTSNSLRPSRRRPGACSSAWSPPARGKPSRVGGSTSTSSTLRATRTRRP